MARANFASVLGSLAVFSSGVALLAAPALARPVEQVRLEARVIEVDRLTAKDLGIQWDAGASKLFATPLPTSVVPNAGATLLGSPSASTAMGRPATIEAGGPIPATNAATSPGDYRLRLEVTPTLTSSGGIALGIEALLPRIDTQVSPLRVESVSAATKVTVPANGSAVIGGLLQDDLPALGNAMPGLSKVPVLGRLFSSTSAKKDETRLFVFVTPILVGESGPAQTGGGSGSPAPGQAPGSDTGAPPLVYGGFDYFGVQASEAVRPDFPLVTTKQLVLVDNPATGRPFQGELTGPNTDVLYDDSETGYPFVSGFKGQLGGWLGRKSRFGFEANGFYVPETTAESTLTSGVPNSFFSVPFYDTSRNFEYSVVIGSALAGSPQSVGRVDVGSSIDFWGVGGALRMRDLVDCDDVDLGFSAGFRYVKLAERFWIDYDSEPTVATAFGQGTLGSYLFAGGALPAAGSRVHAQDDVQSSNDFYGLDLGLDARMEMLPGLEFRIAPRVAIGANAQEVDVFGSGSAWQPNGTMLSTPYGVFARPGYVGTRSETNFAVVPEIDLEFRYRLWKGLQLSAGYNFFYMSNVARAGNQLDRAIDAPIDAFGAFSAQPRAGASRGYETGDFYANSVRLGIRYDF